MLSFVQAYYRFADTMDPDVWFEPSEVICTLNLNNLFSFHLIHGFFGDCLCCPIMVAVICFFSGVGGESCRSEHKSCASCC